MKGIGLWLGVLYVLVLAVVIALRPSLREQIAEWWDELEARP